MAAKPDGLSFDARRSEESEGRNRTPPHLLPVLLLAFALLGGCRNSLGQQNIESKRFLDQYAAGRGLTREQARDEVAAKIREQEEKKTMTAVEDQGVVYR
jgi:hypothetical protein